MKRVLMGAALLAGLVLGGPAGTAVAEAGPADGPCICTKEYNPVMGSDGKKYGNACEAGCAGVEVVGPATDQTAGTDESCICTAQYDPVVGSDGKTYSNACQAGCAGVKVTGPAEDKPAYGDATSCPEAR